MSVLDDDLEKGRDVEVELPPEIAKKVIELINSGALAEWGVLDAEIVHSDAGDKGPSVEPVRTFFSDLREFRDRFFELRLENIGYQIAIISIFAGAMVVIGVCILIMWKVLK